jgi:hypothetical protein
VGHWSPIKRRTFSVWLSLALAVLVALSTTTPLTARAAVTNLLVNPGFENGTASWGQVSPNASVDTLTANAHSGSASLKLAATGYWQATWQFFNSSPGLSYTFGGWERAAAGVSEGWIMFNCWDVNGNSVGQKTLVFNGTGGWTFQQGTFTTPPGTATVGVGLLSDRAGTFWFDDLSLSRP